MARATTEHLIDELDGLRALARSLARGGDADADDLLHDAAVDALEHPPDAGRPVRPWLAAVLRNRWRMTRRSRARELARDGAVVATARGDAAAAPDRMLDRARMLERLAAALVALDEPFRQAVILRYLDGKSAADIARALGVPDGTVRWRVKTGLERLRAALDREAPRPVWQRALIGAPAGFGVTGGGAAGAGKLLLGVGIMKTKSIAIAAVIALLLVGGVVAVRTLGAPDEPAARPAGTSPPGTAGATAAAAHLPPGPAGIAAPAEPGAGAEPDPLPGQGRAIVDIDPGLPGGAFRGRVINWSTGAGVAGAELTFAGGGGDAITVRTDARGTFDLAPPQPGVFSLATVEAAGFLPYAPEWQHSTVRLTSRKSERVRGLTVFLFPAVDYKGTVVDTAGTPVAGAQVRLVGDPSGERALSSPATAWTSDHDGHFVFHAADDAVLEAVFDDRRGRARLDGNVAITHHMVIKLDGLVAESKTISGRVVGDDGAGIAGALVRGVPIPQQAERKPQRMVEHSDTRAVVFATTTEDGDFVLRDVDRFSYELTITADELAPATRAPVSGGATGVTITMPTGKLLRGTVVAGGGDDARPVPAFTLLVFRNQGVARELISARSIVDGGGRFAVPVPPGDYVLLATAPGWAPSAFTPALPETPVTLRLPGGATVSGRVVTAGTDTPVKWARVMREAVGGGASTSPANAGTVTREDGTFELTGIPPGPVSLTIGAGGHHPKIEAGMTAAEGTTIGPLTIALTPLADGEEPKLELVGIGVALGAEEDYLRVNNVIAGGGAEAAGMLLGDRITHVDGAPVKDTGLDGAIAKIRGVPGTRVRITIDREPAPVTLDVERRPLRN